jgi:RNA recognition motif-containing protein
MKLFVAKLNRDVTDADLNELFSRYGEVRYARVVTDRDTGVSKCFGFVHMAQADDARKAMAELNDQEFMRFRMVVKEAEERPAGSAPGGRSGGDDRRSPGGPPRGGRSEGGAPRTDSSGRGGDSREFSRREAPGDAPKPGLRPAPPKKKLPEKRKERDIYADGPKPPKVKREKGRAPGWLDELDDE